MPSTAKTVRQTAGIFDIRNIIGALLGIYGIVLTILGLFNYTDTEKAKTDHFNLNLWTGIGLIIVGGAMILWCKLRPIYVEDTIAEREAAAEEFEKPVQ